MVERLEECDADNVPRGWFNCGYGVCIMEKLVYDGVVNCPFGDCIDEGSCEDAMAQFYKVAGVFNETSAVSSTKQGITSRRPPPRKQDPDEYDTCSMSSLMQGARGALSCNATMEEVKDIKNEFERHNVIFERVSSYIERALNKIEVKGATN